MKTTAKYTIERTDFPVDGYIYNVQKWISVDGGKTYWYCGFGRFCHTFDEAKAWIEQDQTA